MIEPSHECACRGEVILEGNELMGSGAGLRVLMHAFAGHDLVWFSAIYGIHGDNCIAYAVEPEIAATIPKAPMDDVPAIQAAVQGDFKLEEYPLDEAARSALGVHIEGTESYEEWVDEGMPTYINDAELHEEGMRNVRYRVYVHDDCFFSVNPLDDTLLRKLILCILEQHSFYFQQEIDWSPVLEETVAIVSSAPAVEFNNDPRRKRLKLTCKKRGVHMMDALFGRRRSYFLDTASGVARFVSRH
jgi:hypothetical protein